MNGMPCKISVNKDMEMEQSATGLTTKSGRGGGRSEPPSKNTHVKYQKTVSSPKPYRDAQIDFFLHLRFVSSL